MSDETLNHTEIEIFNKRRHYRIALGSLWFFWGVWLFFISLYTLKNWAISKVQLGLFEGFYPPPINYPFEQLVIGCLSIVISIQIVINSKKTLQYLFALGGILLIFLLSQGVRYGYFIVFFPIIFIPFTSKLNKIFVLFLLSFLLLYILRLMNSYKVSFEVLLFNNSTQIIIGSLLIFISTLKFKENYQSIMKNQIELKYRLLMLIGFIPVGLANLLGYSAYEHFLFLDKLFG